MKYLLTVKKKGTNQQQKNQPKPPQKLPNAKNPQTNIQTQNHSSFPGLPMSLKMLYHSWDSRQIKNWPNSELRAKPQKLLTDLELNPKRCP